MSVSTCPLASFWPFTLARPSAALQVPNVNQGVHWPAVWARTSTLTLPLVPVRAFQEGTSSSKAGTVTGLNAEVGAVVLREGVDFGVVDRLNAVGGQQVALQGVNARYDDVLLDVYDALAARIDAAPTP